jgi:hypothetical protein
VVWQWQRSRGDRRRRSGDGVVPASPLADPAFVAGLRPIPSGGLGAEAHPASDIVGVDPVGRPVSIRMDALAQPMLVAFLHVSCDGCDEFWRGFGDSARVELPAGTSAVIVTKGPGTVAPHRILQLAMGIDQTPVIMSDDAWSGYRVLGYPFFVLVDPSSRTVVGETVGFGWSDVVAMIRSARPLDG